MTRVCFGQLVVFKRFSNWPTHCSALQFILWRDMIVREAGGSEFRGKSHQPRNHSSKMRVLLRMPKSNIPSLYRLFQRGCGRVVHRGFQAREQNIGQHFGRIDRELPLPRIHGPGSCPDDRLLQSEATPSLTDRTEFYRR